MALPADALKAVVTVGVSSDISGVIGTIKKLRVQLDECVLIWAKTGHTIEDWSTESVDASFIELEVLADQPGLLTSGLVDGKPSLVECLCWNWRLACGATITRSFQCVDNTKVRGHTE